MARTCNPLSYRGRTESVKAGYDNPARRVLFLHKADQCKPELKGITVFPAAVVDISRNEAGAVGIAKAEPAQSMSAEPMKKRCGIDPGFRHPCSRISHTSSSCSRKFAGFSRLSPVQVQRDCPGNSGALFPKGSLSLARRSAAAVPGQLCIFPSEQSGQKMPFPLCRFARKKARNVKRCRGLGR